MSGFSSEWLALREPADRRARNPDLVGALVAWRRDRASLDIVDLAAGTGATLRYLAPYLGGVQAWQLLDNDGGLLERVLPLTRTWALDKGWRVEAMPESLRVTGPTLDLSVRTRTIDLSKDLLPIGFASNDLVTASALLDLVSGTWLDSLAEHCRRAGAAFYSSLSYDGSVTLTPELPDDRRIGDLVNRHQVRDKGFGAALGPGGGEYAVRSFGDRGYKLQTAPSDWSLDIHDQALLGPLFGGWAEAAAEFRPDLDYLIEAWLERRLDLIRAPGSRTLVGHGDLLALPAD